MEAIIDTVTEFLQRGLDDELTTAPLDGQPEPRLLSPEEEVEHAIDRHRRALDLLLERVAETRASERAALREQEEERQLVEEKYRRDMARIDGEIAAIRAASARTVEYTNKLAGSERQALEALLS